MNNSSIGSIFGSVLVSVLLVGCGGSSDATPVVATNNAPTLSPISSQSTSQSITKAVSITASDIDGDSLTYTLTSDPVNKVTGNVSGSTLTLVPDSTYSGTATLTLKVSDGTSEASRIFSLVVSPNDAPTLSLIASQSTIQGVTKTVSITASDSDGDSLTYTLTSDPVNKVTGSVSGSTLTLVPDSAYSGTATLTLKVSDETREVSQSFALVVRPNSAPTLSSISSQSTNQGVIKIVSISASDSDGDTLTYTLASDPESKITGSVLGSTLTLTPDPTYSGTATLTVGVDDGALTTSESFSLTVAANDPLYQYQWHLHNSGQTNFATNPGTSSEDINVDGVIAAGYTGNNVIVAVVDTGLEIAHEDLSANVVVDGSWDFVGSDTDPTNPSDSDGDHGTSVAGLIASSGWNGKGGRGVAPLASLKGFNFLKNQSTVTNVNSLGAASYSSNVDIFNQSFGSAPWYSKTISATVEAQYLSGVTSLRSGKGAIYIKSSGNGFHRGATINKVGYYCSTIYGASTGLSCQNANMDPNKSTPYNILVGALTAKGKKSSYSTAGSSVWVSAPGGESGTNYPAMMTTDQSGCTNGYVGTYGRAYNAFNTISGGAGHTENVNCNYASTFNGTSSAAPVLSGAVALMLEVNSALTWRDVKHILASTSDQVDASISTTNITINGTTYAAEPAWLTNTAGYKFHNYYGFGRVNVSAAITAAKAYTAGSLGTFATGSWVPSATLNTAIPDYNAIGVSNAVNVSDSKTIEAVQVKLNVSHTNSGVLAVELTSPSGTKSMLLNPRNIFSSSNNLSNFVMLSNAFYGESSSGNWTVKVVDTHSSSDAGQLTDWSIRIFGH